MDEFLSRGWLEEAGSPSEGSRVYLRVTKAGAAALPYLGVTLPGTQSGKAAAFCCLDWTERRWHLGGALGRAIVDALTKAGCVQRTSESRVVNVPGDLHRWLNSN